LLHMPPSKLKIAVTPRGTRATRTQKEIERSQTRAFFPIHSPRLTSFFGFMYVVSQTSARVLGSGGSGKRTPSTRHGSRCTTFDQQNRPPASPEYPLGFRPLMQSRSHRATRPPLVRLTEKAVVWWSPPSPVHCLHVPGRLAASSTDTHYIVGTLCEY
jgi:hypothetical protein